MPTKEKFWNEPVGHLPLQTPLKLSSTATISEAIKAMQKKKTGCVLVVDKDKLVGIFTERDVMLHFVGTSMPNDTPLKQVMTPEPVTLDPKTIVSEAINFFGQKHFRHLPICDSNQKILGLLSVRVMMDFMAEHLPGEVLNLPPEEGLVSTEIVGG